MSNFFAVNGDLIIRLIVAMGLGMIISAERFIVHKEAGMKTHALVSMGAAVFVIISEALAYKYLGLTGFDPGRIASQIIVGIGIAAGFKFYALAVIATVLVLFVLIVVYLIEKPIRKISGDIDQNNI